MASCAYCSTTILFGGMKQGDFRFCNAKCAKLGALVSVANQLPRQEVERYMFKVHVGSCPKCKGAGPVDVHTSYLVWSMLVFTSWSSRPAVCCQSCGTKSKIVGAGFSLLVGWWGIPWGLILTPIQIGRNIVGFFRAPDPSKPSLALERILRLHLAESVVLSQQQRESGVT